MAGFSHSEGCLSRRIFVGSHKFLGRSLLLSTTVLNDTLTICHLYDSSFDSVDKRSKSSLKININSSVIKYLGTCMYSSSTAFTFVSMQVIVVTKQ